MNQPDYTNGNDSPFGDTELQSAQNLMYHDAPLTPKMISSLMHVDTELHNAYLHEAEVSHQGTQSFLYVVGIIFSSILVALIVGTSFLYFQGVGPFYDPLEASTL
jgi:hypothetical protein